MATAESVKTQLSALLNQANGTTGKTDETLTAAIASLAAGFGQGSGSGMVETGEFIGDGVTHGAGNPIQIPLSFEPDFIFICLTDASATLDATHVFGGAIVRDLLFQVSYRNADVTNVANGGFGYFMNGLYGTANINAVYTNGILYLALSPSSRAFYNGAAYTWVARKW